MLTISNEETKRRVSQYSNEELHEATFSPEIRWGREHRNMSNAHCMSHYWQLCVTYERLKRISKIMDDLANARLVPKTNLMQMGIHEILRSLVSPEYDFHENDYLAFDDETGESHSC